MKTLFLSLSILLAYSFSMNYLYDFTADSKTDWQIVDDRVMGGVSQGGYSIDESGNGVFSGHVSLDNNGGFSSLRHAVDTRNVKEFEKVVLRVRGDQKNYQFRLKASNADYYSYIHSFSTSGKWQEIEIPFNAFTPSFRGRALDMPNFPGEQIEELRFLIANKKEQDFRLEIDWIALK